MDYYETRQRIAQIQRLLSYLPHGTLVYKNIKGNKQPYLQWTEEGKSKSRYIRIGEREQVLADIERREKLLAELKDLKGLSDLRESHPDTAFLSNDGQFTIFEYDRHRIRFRAPKSLDRYTEVVDWQDGYLVVYTQYLHQLMPEEEYIDLKPILAALYFDPAEFCKNIKKVVIRYA